MKKALLFLLLSCCLLSASGQVDSTTPPYKRFPTVPPVSILLGDSATKYTKADLPKKKPVLFMLFSPDCSHCQHTAEEMLQRKEDLKNIHIVMVTLHSLTQMNEFVAKYRLNELQNVVVGKDIYFIMPSFYNIRNLPYLAFYDRKGNLIEGFEGSMPVQRILDKFKGR